MSDSNISIEQWHEDEKVWWDSYGSYMSYQWRLTPYLNKIIRSKLDDDYSNFLIKKGDKLLDLGCGSGWLSQYFSNFGMSVLGIDLSQEQINEANNLKLGRSDIDLKFLCADFIHWDIGAYESQFDKVFVNAFLHHLPEVELEMIFKKIAFVLKPGGRVFMYEPLTSSNQSKSLFFKILDGVVCGFSRLLIKTIPDTFDLYNDEHKEAIKKGYVMNSPHERPVDINLIEKFCKDRFEILEVRGWHLYSLGFAMQSMNLMSFLRKIYSFITAILFMVDHLYFSLFGWKIFSRPQRFILCSIKLVKK